MKFGKNRYPSSLALFHLCSSTLVALGEYSQLENPYRNIYFSVKLLLVWLALIPYWIFRKNPESSFASVFLMIIYTIYCWWGASFRPLYELAFFQGFICMAFLRPKIKWFYPFCAVVAGTGLILLRALPNPWGITIPPPDNTGWIEVIIVFSILGVLVHRLYIRERNFREEALARFGFLGRQTVQVAHDLKGLLQGPMTYVDFLKERLPHESDDMVQSLTYMSEDLDKLAAMVMQLNKIALGEDHAQWISLDKVIENNQIILARRSRHVVMDINLPLEIYGRESKINNIFFNLLLNSIESFQRKPVSNPKIQIKADGQNIFYADNGEEHISSLLSEIRNGRVASSKANGGLGLFFINEDLHDIGAQVQFVNCHPGLGIRLKFSRVRPLA